MKCTTANAKKTGRKLRFQFVDKVEQDMKAMPAPMKPLGRILEAAETDLGVAKLAAEAAGRFFSDKYGMQVIVIRLGAVPSINRPEKRRQYPDRPS